MAGRRAVNQPRQPEAGEERIGEERQRDPERNQVARHVRGERDRGIRQPGDGADRCESAQEMEDGEREAGRTESWEAGAQPESENCARSHQYEDEAVRTHALSSLTKAKPTRILGRGSVELESSPQLMV